MTQVNGKTFKVSNKTTNTFELEDIDGTDVNTSGYSTYSSGGTANRIYQITTSYTTAQLFELKFAQSADVLYITHPSHEVSKLSRTGHTSWTLSEVDFAETGPYMDANTTATTLTPASSGTGTGVNITASSTTGINGGDGWQTTDVGRIIKFNGGAAKITARTNTTVVVCTIKDAFTNSDATASFHLVSFSYTTGHPACVSFFEQSLVFAATTDQPQTMFFSKSGDYENAKATLRKILTIHDDYRHALILLYRVFQITCDWENMESIENKLPLNLITMVFISTIMLTVNCLINFNLLKDTI